MTSNHKSSTRTILFGQGEVNGIITPLIPFNCIYDIDFGLIRYMYENGFTANSDLLNPEFFAPFENGDIRSIIIKLYTRTEENPLKLFLKNPSEADNLYNEFMETYYEDIIRSSVHTGIYELCTEFKTEKSISATIIYSNEAEYYMLKDKNLEHIELVDLDELKPDLSKYNSVYFKSTDDPYIDLLVKRLHSKTIYFLDYGFNLKDNSIKENAYTVGLKVNRNRINIINAYDHIRLGMEEPHSND